MASSVHPPLRLWSMPNRKRKGGRKRARREREKTIWLGLVSYLWPGCSRVLFVSCLHTGWSFCPSDLKKKNAPEVVSSTAAGPRSA